MRVVPHLLCLAACAPPEDAADPETGIVPGTTTTSTTAECVADTRDGVIATGLPELALTGEELVYYLPDVEAVVLTSEADAAAWLTAHGRTADLATVDFDTQVLAAGWYGKPTACGAVETALTVINSEDDLRVSWEVTDHGARCPTDCGTYGQLAEVRIAPRPAGAMAACGFLYASCD